MNIEKLLEDMKNDFLYGKMDVKQLVSELGSENFIKFLLDNTGNPNSLVRENVLALVEVDYFSHEECIEMLNTYLGNSHLLNGLGSKENDFVFWRSFSSLVIGYFAEMDGNMNFLSQDQYMEALNKGIEYMFKEVDRRGYVTGKGWAHATAHGADMLLALVSHPKFPIEYADKVLDCIKFHITSPDRFSHGEEKRLSKIIPALIDQGLSEHVIKGWIDSLLPRAKTKIYSDENYEDVKILMNIEYFLVALHFALGEGAASDSIRKYIKEFVLTIWKWAYAHN